MSELPAFSGLNEALWMQPDHLNGLPSLANLNTVDPSTTSSHTPIPIIHNSSRAAQNTVRANQSRGSSRPKRKRPLYSHNRCFQCRDRRLKCEPESRQWPGEKCDPCEKSGLPCSPVQTLHEYKRLKTQPTSLQHTVLNIEPRASAQTLLQDCWVALDWCQMLDQISRVARNVDKSLRRIARREEDFVEEFILNILVGRTKVHRFLSDQIQKACEQVASVGANELYRLLQAVERARLDIGTPKPFVRFYYESNTRKRSLLCATPQLTYTKPEVHNVYTAEANLLSERFLEAIDTHEEFTRAGEIYIQSLHATWNDISDLCERRKWLATTMGGCLKPFIHEFYFRDLALWRRISSRPNNGDIDANWDYMVTDSLGRTALHFATGLLVSGLSNFSDWIAILSNNVASINATDIFGRTPLHIACAVDPSASARCYLRVIGSLLQAKADINVRDRYGLLAIDYAVLGNRTDILKVFKEHRHFDIDDILSAMSEVEVAVQTARDVVKWKITEIEESDPYHAFYGLMI